MYEILSSFAQTGGLIYFVVMFAVVFAYALWPSNQDTFDRASNIPLQEVDPRDE